MARIYGIASKTSTAIGPRMNALAAHAGRDRYVRLALSHPHLAGNTLTSLVWTRGDPPVVSRELLRSETPAVVRQWLAHPPDWLTNQAPQQGLGAEEFPNLERANARQFP